ncbi:MAG TPA: glutamate-1-semialdehyde 2,1-aminomutase [Rhabdochlamydiaceae bacterium]
MTYRPRSEALYNHSCALMPGGVSSPVRAFRDLDLSPLIVSCGKGDTIWDIDDNAYIDFCCSWGALILGHAPPQVVRKATEQLERGSSFGIATQWEKECAEKIISHFPSIDKLRFVSSGTEATMSAIRLARGYTGRSTVVKFDGHYHGHNDALLVSAGSGASHLPEATSQGIPPEYIQHTVSLPFNDSAACSKFLRATDAIAAVILEPIAGNMGLVPAHREFLHMLREETQKKGIVLIFDEVITGFRLGLKGAQGMYGITPDLTCLGKIIGGGFPAAAFGGKREIMDVLAPLGNVYQAGTLSGNPVAMCAGLQTLCEIEESGFYNALEEKTQAFLAPIRHLLHKQQIPAVLHSVGSMFTLFFGPQKVESRSDLKHLDLKAFKMFFKHCFQNGIYLSPSAYEVHFLSSAHTQEHLLSAQRVILDFLNIYF